MKVLIVIGMLIVFISAFFMLFIFDVMIKGGMTCLYEEGLTGCESGNIGLNFMIGLLLVAVFAIVDIAALYLIFNNIFKPIEKPMYF